ncbi:hypothetical protein CYLTODRAFT_190731 [Cylindrobasidium torrendii FP15055 ss-10]|uniref:WIBG Mago-binding domain-containing protein n=1 Tax=Cylindrobasidium torrendii FP15055 ss-10 TaxID=1314674 RepID=A0A0D7BVN3_9AGAR|nr:hypothetical protein CYLTODRAFT_190731 [Cylindrobasidium torrendii FP15055 ss-10]
MARPPINPDKTLAGIAIDPQTLQRVIPESRRPDGSVRKELKVRPGFTPQEDVQRFRGTRQAQADSRKLPPGHVVGWTPPPQGSDPTKPMSKSQKKNAKRKEKKEEKKPEVVKDNWDDEEEETPLPAKPPASKPDPNPDALAEDMKKLELSHPLNLLAHLALGPSESMTILSHSTL